jgi:hypothetical protein
LLQVGRRHPVLGSLPRTKDAGTLATSLNPPPSPVYIHMTSANHLPNIKLEDLVEKGQVL